MSTSINLSIGSEYYQNLQSEFSSCESDGARLAFARKLILSCQALNTTLQNKECWAGNEGGYMTEACRWSAMDHQLMELKKESPSLYQEAETNCLQTSSSSRSQLQSPSTSSSPITTSQKQNLSSSSQIQDLWSLASERLPSLQEVLSWVKSGPEPDMSQNKVMRPVIRRQVRAEIDFSALELLQSNEEIAESESVEFTGQHRDWFIQHIDRFSASAASKVLAPIDFSDDLNVRIADQKESYEATAIVVHTGYERDGGEYKVYSRDQALQKGNELYPFVTHILWSKIN